MEGQGIILIKSFLLGVLLGYIAGYLIIRSIKFLFLVFILVTVLIYLSDQTYSLFALFEITSDYFITFFNRGFIILSHRMEKYLSCNFWILGSITGFLISLIRKK